MDHSNTAKKDRPRYASLTAGLLARKGEAVPVAASFSPEAMAQHLPAKRLAQEFENENMTGWNPFRSFERNQAEEVSKEPDLTSGPLDQRTSKIEEALADETGGFKVQAPELDLFGDESADEVEGSDLGLDALVDRAIESAQRNRFGIASESASGEDDGPADAQQTKPTCATAKADLVASIRNANLAEQGNGTGVALDPRRYIRLQVAAMKLDVTKQELMSAALDSFLDTLLEDVFSECSCMQKGLI